LSAVGSGGGIANIRDALLVLMAIGLVLAGFVVGTHVFLTQLPSNHVRAAACQTFHTQVARYAFDC